MRYRVLFIGRTMEYWCRDLRTEGEIPLISEETVDRWKEHVSEHSEEWWTPPTHWLTRSWYTYRPWGSRHTIIKLDNMPKLPGACVSSIIYLCYDAVPSYNLSVIEAISEQDLAEVVKFAPLLSVTSKKKGKRPRLPRQHYPLTVWEGVIHCTVMEEEVWRGQSEEVRDFE